ncbi:hypothetical protein FACS1894113_5060 [Alphaproteobacteria bacterium]|nr:hypothetical protein FACS1894113_5060 [Alphaproteobacteria bacterium]
MKLKNAFTIIFLFFFPIHCTVANNSANNSKSWSFDETPDYYEDDEIYDPFEKFNRVMFSFNNAIDKVFIKPVATVYKRAVPRFLQCGIEKGKYINVTCSLHGSDPNDKIKMVVILTSDKLLVRELIVFGITIIDGIKAIAKKYCEDTGKNINTLHIDSRIAAILAALDKAMQSR